MLHSSGFVPVGFVVFVSATLGLTCSTAVFGAKTDSNYQCEAFDPEFHEDVDIFIYQHINKLPGPPESLVQQGVAQFIDPMDNGDLINDTDGIFVEDLAPYQDSQAGPKFSNGEENNQAETFIAYTRLVDDDLLAVGLRKYDDQAAGSQTGAHLCFPSNLDGQVPETFNIGDTDRSFVYTTEDEALDLYRAQALYNYQDEDTSEDNGLRWAVLEDWLPGGTGGEEVFENDAVAWGRLQELRTGTGPTNRRPKAVTTYDDPVEGDQVFLIDAANPNSVGEIQVTSGAGHKFAPYLFFNEDPENNFDTNMVVFRRTLSALPIKSDIVTGTRQLSAAAPGFLFLR